MSRGVRAVPWPRTFCLREKTQIFLSVGCNCDGKTGEALTRRTFRETSLCKFQWTWIKHLILKTPLSQIIASCFIIHLLQKLQNYPPQDFPVHIRAVKWNSIALISISFHRNRKKKRRVPLNIISRDKLTELCKFNVINNLQFFYLEIKLFAYRLDLLQIFNYYWILLFLVCKK